MKININYQILSIALLLCIGFLLYNKQMGVSPRQAVLDTIFTRTSVRSYTNEKVSDADLELLVKAGMAAPTAANMQPWSFIIITNKETMSQYAKINKYAAMALTAPAAIVVIGDLDVYKSRPNMAGYWPQDTSAATENILLAANSMGLGAVWTGIYSENTAYAHDRILGTQKLLDLPPNKIPLNMIFVGYPKGDIQPKDKWKPSKLSWIK